MSHLIPIHNSDRERHESNKLVSSHKNIEHFSLSTVENFYAHSMIQDKK